MNEYAATAAPGRCTRTIQGREIVFDDDGFFTDFEDWTDAVFEILAEENGITRLSDWHWRVVWFLRDFYAYHGRAPLNRDIREGSGLRILEVERLFPGGIKNGARRLAGLPNPKTCD